jgi:hypothetical protein
MRRIIERVVTVVTTTTWKITWEPDGSQKDLSGLDVLSENTDDAQTGSPVNQTKEDGPAETEQKTTSHT